MNKQLKTNQKLHKSTTQSATQSYHTSYTINFRRHYTSWQIWCIFYPEWRWATSDL